MDVIIIGAGPVGCYTAGILGAAGLKVRVFEKRAREDVKKEIGIIHFDVEDYEPLGIPRPPTDDPLYLGTFKTLWQVPFDKEKKFPVHYPTDIVRMTPFISWIADFAKRSGNVEFSYESPYQNPIVDADQVKGVEIGNGIGEIRADLTIDCSGRTAVVRNSLPDGCGIPKIKPREGRLFTLHMERWKCKSDFPRNSNTYVSFKGFANQVGPDETLVGASTLEDYDGTKRHFKKMLETQGLAEIDHSVEEVLGGEVPYDFPPHSLVGSGFLSIGDSAFQNKPFNGEGMSSGMKAAQIALPVILNAFDSGDFSKSALWDYNVDFFRGFGSDFAMIRGTGETLVELSPEEFDWMFENGFTNQKLLTSTWRDYKAKVGIKTILAAIRGLKRWDLMKKILHGMSLGVKLKRLYKNYPRRPEGVAAWKSKFDQLMDFN